MCHVFSEQVAQTTTAPGVVFSLISLIPKIQTCVWLVRFHRCYEKINQSDWTHLTHVSWLRDIMDLFHMRPANERRRYIVTSSLIGRVHTQNDPRVMRGGRLYSCYKKKNNYWTCGFCHGRLKNGKRYSLNSGYVPLVMLCFMFFHKQLSIHPSHPSASPSIHIHPSIHPPIHPNTYSSIHQCPIHVDSPFLSPALKTKSRHDDVNFVVTCDAGGCHNDNIRCHQWRQLASWRLSVFNKVSTSA